MDSNLTNNIINIDSNTVSGILGLLGALFGSGIGGYITLKVAKDSFQQQRQQADENEKSLIRSLQQAIHDEVETVFDRYQETMGTKIENLPEGEGLIFYYPLESDYFAVYNGNTSTIGRIDDDNLRKQIIKTYMLLKGMVDSFRFNNHLVHKYEFSLKLFDETQDETQKEIHKKYAIGHYNILITYAKSLKEGHENLKQEIITLLHDLKNALKKI